MAYHSNRNILKEEIQAKQENTCHLPYFFQRICQKCYKNIIKITQILLEMLKSIERNNQKCYNQLVCVLNIL